jgi:putative DNA primase/helicase
MNNFEREGLISQCASEIEPEAIEWIWESRIAVGKHTCIAGEPGTGKSQLSMFIASTISMGGKWPCGEGEAPQGSVIILSAEDGIADTIVPRLHAVDADLGRVHIVSAVRTDWNKSRGFNLQADIDLLEQEIERIGDVALVIIDPISSYLGKADSHKNAEVRGVLEPLSAMAERAKVAVLSITHFSKAGAISNAKALHRFIGSIAFVGAPRVAFTVIEDPENEQRRLFLHAKNNLAAPPRGLAFGLRQSLTTIGHPSFVRWEAEPVSMTADEALAAGSARDGARPCDEAAEFLKELLSDGPVAAKKVRAEAEDAGLAWRTVRRAKDKLKVIVTRDGFGPGGTFHWRLPDPIVGQSAHRCPSNKVDPYEESGHRCDPKGDHA